MILWALQVDARFFFFLNGCRHFSLFTGKSNFFLREVVEAKLLFLFEWMQKIFTGEGGGAILLIISPSSTQLYSRMKLGGLELIWKYTPTIIRPGISWKLLGLHVVIQSVKRPWKTMAALQGHWMFFTFYWTKSNALGSKHGTHGLKVNVLIIF